MSEKSSSESLQASPNHGLAKKYLYFLIFYMVLYETFDSYTTSFYPTIVSFVITDFETSISDYYIALSIASLGLYAVILLQFLTDIVGRKPMMIIVFFGMGFATFLLGFSQNLSQFTFALFLMFLFFSSDIWLIIISEEAPKEKRGRYAYIVTFLGVFGVFTIPLFRSLLVDPAAPHTWIRMTYFAWIAMPLALLGFFLKESTAFTEKESRKKMQESKWSKAIILAKLKEPFMAEHKTKTIGFILIGFALGLNFTTFQTVEAFLMDELRDSDFVSFLILVAGLGSMVVYGFTGLLADKFGRKTILILYSAALTIGIIGLAVMVPKQSYWGSIIFIFIADLGYWGCFTLSKVFCVECFPTEIRGGATGLRSFAYAIGLTVGSLISAGLTKIMSLGTSYVINMLWISILIPLVVLFLLPETKGKEIVLDQ